MNNEFLVEVFGRTHGFAHKYVGTSTDITEITVEFCSALDDHKLDTTVTQLRSSEWVVWSHKKLENNPHFELILELSPIVPEPYVPPDLFIPDGSTLPPLPPLPTGPLIPPGFIADGTTFPPENQGH